MLRKLHLCTKNIPLIKIRQAGVDTVIKTLCRPGFLTSSPNKSIVTTPAVTVYSVCRVICYLLFVKMPESQFNYFFSFFFIV